MVLNGRAYFKLVCSCLICARGSVCAGIPTCLRAAYHRARSSSPLLLCLHCLCPPPPPPSSPLACACGLVSRGGPAPLFRECRGGFTHATPRAPRDHAQVRLAAQLCALGSARSPIAGSGSSCLQWQLTRGRANSRESALVTRIGTALPLRSSVRPRIMSHVQVHSAAHSTAPLLCGLPFSVSLLWLFLNFAACGCIVGLCRLMPRMAEERFGLHSHAAILGFIVAFGVCKAGCNLVVGVAADRYGRRALLRAGWALSLLTPLFIGLANSWSWILVATGLLGASQGLCTSCAVVMVMDLVPASARGVAMGALECVIYVSLGLGALAASEMLACFPPLSHPVVVASSSSVAGSTTTASIAVSDFRPVIAAHFAMCIVGALTSWRVMETKDIAMRESINAARSSLPPGAQAKEELWQHSDDSESETEEDRERSDQQQQQQQALQWSSLRSDGAQQHEQLGLDSFHVAAAGPARLPHASTSQVATPVDTPGPAGSLQLRFPTPLLDNGQSASSSAAAASSHDASNGGLHSSVSPRHYGDSTAGASEDRSLLRNSAGLLTNPSFTSASAASLPPPTFLSSLRSSLHLVVRSPILLAILQSGFANNLKDGVCWGLLPGFFSSIPAHAQSANRIGWLLTAYPLVWGLGQLATGRASDVWGRGRFIWAGLATQAFALGGLVATPWATALLHVFAPWLLSVSAEAQATARFILSLWLLLLLGFGTALSYPVLQAYIGDVVAPARRAGVIGLYRLCRDLGYAGGGILSGIVADAYGIDVCIAATAGLLCASALYSFVCLPKDDLTATNSGQQKEAK